MFSISSSHVNPKRLKLVHPMLRIEEEAASNAHSIIVETIETFCSKLGDVMDLLDYESETAPGDYVCQARRTTVEGELNCLEFGRYASSRDRGIPAEQVLSFKLTPCCHIERRNSLIHEDADFPVFRIDENTYNQLKDLWNLTLNKCWDAIIRECSKGIADEGSSFLDPGDISEEDQEKASGYLPEISHTNTDSSLSLFVKTVEILSPEDREFLMCDHDIELYYGIRASGKLMEITTEERSPNPLDDTTIYTDRETALELYDEFWKSMGNFRDFAEDNYFSSNLEPITYQDIKRGQIICVIDQQFPGFKRLQVCRITKVEQDNEHFKDVRGEIIFYNGERLQVYKSSTLEVRSCNTFKVPAQLYTETMSFAKSLLASLSSLMSSK